MHADFAKSIGSVQLYHPRGPLVTLPVPGDPREALAHVVLCLDAGWLVTAPGLEEGEHREDVGYVLRGSVEQDGQVTPTLLLYPAKETLAFSFLKVYLNTPADVAAFEFASKMKLDSLPEYTGSDKPERGKSTKQDRFIVKAARPFGVVVKANPKFDEHERAESLKKGMVYKVPARVFVRWADQLPPETQAASKPETPPGSTPAPATKPANASPRPTTPAPTNRQATPAKSQSPTRPPVQTIEDKHRIVLNGFRSARTVGYVKEMAAWAQSQNFPDWMTDEQSDAFHEAMDRIAPEMAHA